jgi:hypothetical protein
MPGTVGDIMSTFYRDDYLTILENPSAPRLQGFLARSGYHSLRGVLTETGDLYVWDAEHMIHSDLDCIFGIVGLRIDIGEVGATVVLAGGAHELMLPSDNLETFFEQHGHPGATLDDVDVIEAICDAACEEVRGHRSFKNSAFQDIDADIDPRLAHGRTNLAIVAEGLVPHRMA